MPLDEKIIADIRRFNRFYTKMLGILDKHVLDTGYSLTEARVILEIGFMEPCIANQLVDKLGMDRSYMSRIIAKLQRDGLIGKEQSPLDNRMSLIRLTPKGIALFEQLNERSDEQIARLLHGLSPEEVEEIHASMKLLLKKLDRLERIQDDTV
ncbi:MarR family transcriptional regulator [Brevibacillus brevis]|uniref:MarR family transcriptional regulator n=1 Tax=Brevibacillus brevis TaxID=1393 RepID=A0ABY9SXV2_BREBE|nr:MarR family transcriptional regulator [Brevibacillus brevis]WNC12639.1 MarR family transcriptional regulator [Brevibacillus brevis]